MSQIPLGPGPVLPPNDLWVKEHLTSIVEATTKTNLDNAIDAFLSKKVEIVVNGAKESRENFQKLLEGQRDTENPGTIKFDGTVQALNVDNSQDKNIVGAVGVFYTTMVIKSVRALDPIAQRDITSSLNVVIEKDPTLKPTNPEFFDPRRVLSLNLVYLETNIL